MVVITATASTTTQGEYTPDTAFADALADIQANKVVIIKLENVAGRYYMPYSSSNAEILASAGTVSGSNQSIELYTLKWTATTNIITLTGTKEGCTADGGTKGQVLAKKSDESFDTEWIDAGTGGGDSDIVIAIYENNALNKTYDDLLTAINANKIVFIKDLTSTFNPYYLYQYTSTKYGLVFTATTRLYEAPDYLRVPFFAIKSDGTITHNLSYLAGLVPDGGTTGQYLCKTTNDNYNVKWENIYVKANFSILWQNNNLDNFQSQEITLQRSNNEKIISNLTILFADSTEVVQFIFCTISIPYSAKEYNFKMVTENGYRVITYSEYYDDKIAFTAGFNTKTNTTDNSIAIPFEIYATTII